MFDVPTTAHIPSLVSSFRDSAFFNKVWGPCKTSDVVIRAIYHICGDGVLEDSTYKAFMSGFAEDVQVSFVLHCRLFTNAPLKHLVASKKHNPDPLTFTSAGIQQIRVNKIDDKLFPIPKFSVETPIPLPSFSIPYSCLLFLMFLSCIQFAAECTTHVRGDTRPDTPHQASYGVTRHKQRPVPLDYVWGDATTAVSSAAGTDRRRPS